jgi:D-apiose dehydrogenase
MCTTRPGAGAFGGACTALQAHVLAHLAHGTALENDAASYLTNLRRAGRRLPVTRQRARVVMATFDPDKP